MKTLLLIRHGRAEPREKYRHDADRPLTADGAHEVEQVARGLARLASPTLILTSPLLRARQTAELIANAFNPPPMLATLDALADMSDLPDLLAQVDRHGDHALALVGHEPGMGELVSFLLAGRRTAPIDFKKAAVCRFDVTGKPGPGSGTLAWLIPPKVMRLVARK